MIRSPPSVLALHHLLMFLAVLRFGSSSRWAATALVADSGSTIRSASAASRRRYTNHSPAAAFLSSSSNNLPILRPQKNSLNRKALYSTQTSYYDADLLTSTSSNTVKRFIGLQQKPKKRRETGEAVVEGPRMVLDLLANPATRPYVQQLLLSTELEEDIRDELGQLLLEEEGADNDNNHTPIPISVQMATPNVIKACSDTVTPQGILARVQIPPWTLDNLSIQQQQQQAPLYLVLDGVSDPGNLGTLLRSSVAVGVSAVLLLPGSCDVWNPKAVRSAMGASFLVPTFSMSSWDEALQTLQQQSNDNNSNNNGQFTKHNIWAATMLEDDQGRVVSSAHYDIDWKSSPQALIIGSEGTGLSPAIRKSLAAGATSNGNDDNDNNDDEGLIRAVHVPMEGTIESLNAAVCGSVIMFEYMRQWKQQQSST